MPTFSAMGNQTSTLIKSSESRLVQAGKRVKPPHLFHVVMLNDDYTPMDFVTSLLQRVFGYSEEEAASIMKRVHTEGRGVCGTYTRDIAMTKAAQVESLARGHEHPLRCTIEPE